MAFETIDMSEINADEIGGLCKEHNLNPIYIGNMAITCGKLSVIRDVSYKFNIILNCSGAIFNGHEMYLHPLMEQGLILMPEKYGDTSMFYTKMFPSVITLPWGDFQAPPVKLLFWDAFVFNYESEHKADTLGPNSIAICCNGGHGRTGTALAAIKMAYEASVNNHISDVQTISWVRENYCLQAIETRSQMSYLNDLYRFLLQGQMIENIEK